jgi:hypothetical protein
MSNMPNPAPVFPLEIICEILAYLPILGIKKRKLHKLMYAGSLFWDTLQPFLFQHMALGREDLTELVQLFTNAGTG